jgi:ABC-type branched-subunit amino acid transport system substrate-binding protein
MRRVAIQAAGVLLMAASMLLGSGALATSDLSQQEDEGRALFLTGQINAPPPYALVGAGDVRVPATAIPCASCHGHDGRGRAERGIEPPNITWSALSASNGGSGPKRPPYSETSVIRAITMGIGADGNRLDPVMPRFQLTSGDAAALLTYLKRLGTLPQPGLDDHALMLGTVVVGPDAAVGSVLSAYFAKINRDGGLFGRQLGLRTEKLAAGETAGRGIARLIKSDAIFAVLAPDTAGDERGVIATADADGMPVIGPLTSNAQAAPRSRYVFYLNGGMAAEARALAGFATTLPGSPSIVDDGTSSWHAVAVAAAATLSAAGHIPRLWSLDDLARIPSPGPVLWFADQAPDQRELGTRTALLVPRALAAEVLSHGASAQTWIAFAAGQPDVTQDAEAEFRALAARNGQGAEDRPSQCQALAAAKILMEALRRAGRDVTRERLVDALETLQDFHTGLIPPVSYSATRRIGSAGAWIVPFAGGEPIWWDR